MNHVNITTWLAHGTLLGWYWNNEIMPWDNDLDVQVWASDLFELAKYNQTLYNYATTILPATKKSAYKSKSQQRIPVPSEPEQFRRTYLLDVNPYHSTRDGNDWMNVIDARWIDTTTGLFVDITGLADTGRNTWTCKNYHRYPKAQLETMIPSIFEGAKAVVPQEFRVILNAEYGDQCLTREKFAKHTFWKETAEWVRDGAVGLG
jgi:phosphorylcholine metabolism protein LicD